MARDKEHTRARMQRHNYANTCKEAHQVMEGVMARWSYTTHTYTNTHKQAHQVNERSYG